MWPQASDEGRHPVGPEPGWEESWEFDFIARDQSLGGAVRLGLRGGEAWYWAHFAGPGRDLVAVRDHELHAPRGRALEVRGSGLWAELTCETPLDHWSAGLEAVGVAFDHPTEAYGSERGQPVAVGLDLEWEVVGPVVPRSVGPLGPGLLSPSGAGYGQPCEVHGEVLVGNERIAVDASGWRTHDWGALDWWGAPQWRAHGRLDDGTVLSAGGTSDDEGAGVLVAFGEAAEAVPGEARLEIPGRDQLPGRATLTVGEEGFDVTPLVHAPVLVPGPERPYRAGGNGPGSQARLWRAMCRFTAAGGREGTGWCQRVDGGSLGPA